MDRYAGTKCLRARGVWGCCISLIDLPQIYDIYGLVALNIMVWLLWSLFGRKTNSCMRRHCTPAAQNIFSCRLHSLFFSTISYEDFQQLCVNMMWLLAIGPELQITMGRDAVCSATAPLNISCWRVTAHMCRCYCCTFVAGWLERCAQSRCGTYAFTASAPVRVSMRWRHSTLCFIRTERMCGAACQ
jgi:hypothetical protein